VPRLRHPPDRGLGRGPAAQDDADPEKAARRVVEIVSTVEPRTLPRNYPTSSSLSGCSLEDRL